MKNIGSPITKLRRSKKINYNPRQLNHKVKIKSYLTFDVIQGNGFVNFAWTKQVDSNGMYSRTNCL
jgi:hypothetical protein